MGSTGHQPTVSAEYAAQIRRWHERAYREGAERTSETTFSHLGTTIVVPPRVMPVTPVSHLLGEAVLERVRPGDRVLDMGTGSGVNAVLAATAGARVIAVDTDPRALDTAAANAARNGVAERVELRRSDVFEAVDETFDLIVFDPPFRWFRPRDRWEAATTDEDYRALGEFFSRARRHLSSRGVVLIFFGTSGDLGHLTHLISENGFTAGTLAHDQVTRDGWTVDYFTYLVS